MPSIKSTNCEMAFPKPRRKAPGTRVGMLQDWRQGSTSGKAPRRKANALRDGR
jgi:hypothetical protein